MSKNDENRKSRRRRIRREKMRREKKKGRESRRRRRKGKGQNKLIIGGIELNLGFFSHRLTIRNNRIIISRERILCIRILNSNGFYFLRRKNPFFFPGLLVY